MAILNHNELHKNVKHDVISKVHLYEQEDNKTYLSMIPADGVIRKDYEYKVFRTLNQLRPKYGIDFNFLHIFKDGKEYKVCGVLDFNEPMPIDDKVVSCELRFNMGDHDIPIEEYKKYSLNVSSVIDNFAESILATFPQGDVKFMTTKNDDEINRFYLCFYNTVDDKGEFLSDDEINNTMAWDLALIFTECGLKITYLVESY